MSASLLTTMTLADVNSTLEILSEHDVTAEDLKFLRKYRKGIARHIAKEIKRVHQLFDEAIAGSCEAVKTLGELGHVDVLMDIYARSKEPSVWVAVMEALTDKDTIYNLIRIYSQLGREEASLIGARKLSRYYLNLLLVDDGYQNLNTLAWRRELVVLVVQEKEAIEYTPADRRRADRE